MVIVQPVLLLVLLTVVAAWRVPTFPPPAHRPHHHLVHRGH